MYDLTFIGEVSMQKTACASFADSEEQILLDVASEPAKMNCVDPNPEVKYEIQDGPVVTVGFSIQPKEQNYSVNRSGIGPNADPKFPNIENGGRISYISKGWWTSKLVVQYINGRNELEKHEASESSCPIEIPENAKNIEVSFKVLRFIGVWCDIKKYDRFKKCWCKPTEPHIFKYKRSPIRTFIIYGSLYYEAVMGVKGSHEVGDM